MQRGPQVAIGWYEAIVGAVGLIITLVLAFGPTPNQVSNALIAMAPFCLLATAGVLTIAAKKAGVILSVIVQILQVPIFALLGTSWRFIAGVAVGVVLTPEKTRFFAAAETTFSATWKLAHLEAMIGINIIPIVIITILLRAGAKKNQAV